MKKIITLLAFISAQFSTYAQDFTWVKGSNTGGLPGVYGTQGVSAPANNPGARHGCAKWTDAAGNLWLFGGEGYSSNATICWLNDLWKFNITTKEWTWIRGSNGPDAHGVYGTMGVAASTNEPGAREFVTSWTDASGNFWMFGGDGFGSSTSQTNADKLGDLWKYNPLTNEWTWMNGFNTVSQPGVYGTIGVAAPGNMPGTRMGCGSWTDGLGNLWLFGGQTSSGMTLNYMNDLWKYSISTNQWTWVSGGNISNQNGSYGTMGVASITNFPGTRRFPNCWLGSSNDLFFMGGEGHDGSTSIGRMNDIWRFDPIAGTWTWINGSNLFGPSAVHGTQNVASAATSPGGRFSSATWKDPFGKVWIFGGRGLASGMVTDMLNDLFKYDPLTNLWTWVKGSTTLNQNGTYGTLGVEAPANVPGARMYNTMWTGNNGNLWLFGGEGYDGSNPSDDNLSDLWLYRIPCNPDSIVVNPGKSFCIGTTLTPTLTAVNGGTSTTWYSSAASTNSLSGGVTFTFNPATVNTQSVYTYYAEANACPLPRTPVSITVNALPTVTVASTQTFVCRGQTTPTLFAGGANTYVWSILLNPSSATLIVSPTVNTTYTVIGTDLNGCANSATITIRVAVCPGIEEVNQNNIHSTIYPNPNRGEFTFKLGEKFNKIELSITNALGQTVLVRNLSSDETFVKTNLPKGVYFYQLITDSNKKSNGKLVIE